MLYFHKMTQITPEIVENTTDNKITNDNNLTETEMEEDEVASVSGGTTHSEESGTCKHVNVMAYSLQTLVATNNLHPT